MARKLKVFRTPIGFHDAFVAAPSRKAALAAWGSDVDLFARGVAEEVHDAALMRQPLANPGQVIKLSRGSKAQQIAALPKASPRRNAAVRARPPDDPAAIRRSVAQDKRIAKAQAALADAERAYRDKLAALTAEEAALRAKRKTLEAERAADLKRLRDALDTASAKRG